MGLLPLLTFLLISTPIVSDLHTISIHVDSPETFNSLLSFFEKELKWPLIYGKPWTPAQTRRRSYAGIWVGNVVLEPCGPYEGETFPEGVRARLHGLTFRPADNADASATELHQLKIPHKGPLNAGDNLRFIYLNDTDLTGPALAVSIMQVKNQQREQDEQAIARSALLANQGGPLGVKSVKEIKVTYPNAQTLAKWKQLLNPADRKSLEVLRFVEGTGNEIAAIVIQVGSLEKARSFLKDRHLLGDSAKDSVEINRTSTHGVRILLTE